MGPENVIRFDLARNANLDIVEGLLVHIGGDEHVERLGLADIFGPVSGKIDDPALVELEGRLEHVFFIIGQEIEMLDGAFMGRHRRPDLVRILAFFSQQFLQILVADVKRPGQRLMGKRIRHVGFDPRRGPAADDRNRRRRRKRHLVGEAFHDSVVGGIGAGAAFFGQLDRGNIGLGATTKGL